MLSGLPLYIDFIFILTALLALGGVGVLVKNSRVTLAIAVWILVQALLAWSGFYTDTMSMPPRLLLAVLPPLLAILLALFSKRGGSFVTGLDARGLVLLSLVRIPVELVLYWLYQNDAVPKEMTFTGRNFDMLAGLTAPLVAAYCFQSSRIIHKTVLLVWNILSLGLLLNIMVNAFLALPRSYRQFAFEVPNKAVLYFPFIWLPSFIVMAVLFSHLILFKKLMSLNPPAATNKT
jgi:hypothetical protein